VEDET